MLENTRLLNETGLRNTITVIKENSSSVCSVDCTLIIKVDKSNHNTLNVETAKT